MVVPLTRHYPDLVVCVPDRSTWKIVVRMEIGPLLNAGIGATPDKADSPIHDQIGSLR
jgi:hypothetical protein